MDAEKVRAYGPWVLIQPEGEIKITPGGIHVPENNAAKVGYAIGRVKSVGQGHWTKVGDPPRDKYQRPEVEVGQRVAYRAHLANSCKFGDHSFIHMRDLELAVDEGAELNLAHPYDN